MDGFHKHDPIQPDEIDKMFEYLDFELRSLVKTATERDIDTIVGSSGTFETLSSIYTIKEAMPKQKGAERPFDMNFFDPIYQEIVTKNRNERMQIPGMVEMRVNMIVVATCLIKFVVDRLKIHSIRVSGDAMKEGILNQLLKGQL